MTTPDSGDGEKRDVRVASAGAALQRLAGGFLFSATPMLSVDEQGRVEEINIALNELTGRDLAGAVGASLHAVAGRLGPRCSGPPLSECLTGPAAPDRPWRPTYGQIGVSETSFDYDSPDYGVTRLRSIHVPCIDATTGTFLGTAISLVVDKIGDPERYAAALRQRWAHEIMWVIYAASYDQILTEMPFYCEVVDRHLAALRGGDAKRVLDLGAGTGNVAVPLLDEGREVVAVEVSRAMTARLRSKVSAPSADRLTVVLGTAESLPQLPDAGFDGVSALLSLFDMDDPRAALAEAVRLLRPGATLVITDPKAGFDIRPLMEFAEAHLRGSGLLPALADDWARVSSVAPGLESRIRAARPDGEGVAAGDRWDAESILRTLRDLGFADLSSRDSHLGQCATIVGRKPSGSGGLQAGGD